VTLLKSAAAGLAKAWTTPHSRDVVYHGTSLFDLLDGGAIALPGGLSQSYSQLYRSQIWVHVVVNKLARGIGRLPLKIYKRGKGRQRVTEGSLYDLLSAPSGRQTPMGFKERLVADQAVYGNAITVMVGPGAGKPPTTLRQLPPVGWEIKDGRYLWRDGATGEGVAFDEDQVIHLGDYTPGSPRRDWSVSSLEPLRLTLAIEYAAQRLGVSSFENGAKPGGVLSTDQALKPDVAERLSKEAQKLYGGVEKAYKLAVFSHGLKFSPMNWNLNESAVIEHRKLTREEVAAVYDIPPPLIGILDRATFSNIETQVRMFYTETLGPRLALIEETLQTQLIDPVPEWAGLYVEFDLNEVLKGDPERRFRTYSQAINAGIFTQNEVRELENRDRMEDQDADRLHRPMNLTPDAAPTDDTPQPTGEGQQP
jgi:HK97 family phage portal protein